MRRKLHKKVHLAFLSSLVALGAVLTLYHAAASQKTPPVLVLDVADAISPGTSEYIAFGIEEAARKKAQLLVIRLDTPGGLVTSTRDIVQAIFGSSVPVAVYVAPGGARAASAGTFITMSAHIAAMAPGTNIGAASPVSGGGKQIQGDMRKKAMNDVAAFRAGGCIAHGAQHGMGGKRGARGDIRGRGRSPETKGHRPRGGGREARSSWRSTARR